MIKHTHIVSHLAPHLRTHTLLSHTIAIELEFFIPCAYFFNSFYFIIYCVGDMMKWRDICWHHTQTLENVTKIECMTHFVAYSLLEWIYK